MADLIITITIPDAARADFLAAYAEKFGWVDQATSGAKAVFARDQATRMIRTPLRQYRQNRIIAAATAALPDDDGITAI